MISRTSTSQDILSLNNWNRLASVWVDRDVMPFVNYNELTQINNFDNIGASVSIINFYIIEGFYYRMDPLFR